MSRLVIAQTVDPEEVAWFWYPYLPRGELSILAGTQGTGKTWIGLDLAARITTGRPLPTYQAGEAKRAALVYTTEDDLGKTVRPRLEAMGADLSAIGLAPHPINLAKEGGPDQLKEDIEEVVRATQRKMGLVVMDPIQAFIGSSTDWSQANQTRPILTNVVQIARYFDTTVLFTGHFRKGVESSQVLNRVLASVDITAVARSVCITAVNPAVPDAKAFAHVKTNYARSLGPPLTYTLSDEGVLWDETPGTLDLETILGSMSAKDASALDRAIHFLQDLFTPGFEIRSAELEDLIKNTETFGMDTLRRARHHLDFYIEVAQLPNAGGGAAGWFWKRPPEGS